MPKLCLLFVPRSVLVQESPALEGRLQTDPMLYLFNFKEFPYAEFLCIESHMEKNIAILLFVSLKWNIDHCMENFTM